jgi:hypothetical protein
MLISKDRVRRKNVVLGITMDKRMNEERSSTRIKISAQHCVKKRRYMFGMEASLRKEETQNLSGFDRRGICTSPCCDGTSKDQSVRLKTNTLHGVFHAWQCLMGVFRRHLGNSEGA